MFGSLRAAILPIALLCVGTPAIAQVPESPVSYTGTIVATADQSVTLATKDGQVTVAMSPGWTVGVGRTAAPADIKPGDFIATTNANVDASTGRSSEVRIFEPGYRPEIGTHPMPTANTSMTHGTVSAAKPAADGVQLTVTYPSGSRTILVSAATKVTAYDLRDRALAKPGAVATAVTRKDKDGVARAGRLLVVTP